MGYIIIYIYWLVVLTILKNMSSSMGRIIPYIMENKKWLKPPTSIYIYIYTYYKGFGCSKGPPVPFTAFTLAADRHKPRALPGAPTTLVLYRP